jgi:hypothetical protein
MGFRWATCQPHGADLAELLVALAGDFSDLTRLIVKMTAATAPVTVEFRQVIERKYIGRIGMLFDSHSGR